MAYGINPALFVEDGPTIQAAKLARARNSARFAVWQTLNPDHRFEVVERALKAPANDLIDAVPVAL